METGSIAETYGRLAGPEVKQAVKSAPNNAELVLTIQRRITLFFGGSKSEIWNVAGPT